MLLLGLEGQALHPRPQGVHLTAAGPRRHLPSAAAGQAADGWRVKAQGLAEQVIDRRGGRRRCRWRRRRPCSRRCAAAGQAAGRRRGGIQAARRAQRAARGDDSAAPPPRAAAGAAQRTAVAAAAAGCGDGPAWRLRQLLLQLGCCWWLQGRRSKRRLSWVGRPALQARRQQWAAGAAGAATIAGLAPQLPLLLPPLLLHRLQCR